MAAKTGKTRTSKTNKKSRSTRKSTTKLQSSRKRLYSILAVALVSGFGGVLMLLSSGAIGPSEKLLKDDPARGLVYHGKKVKTRGPCKGQFEFPSNFGQSKKAETPAADVPICGHLDPTPPGVDIRERAKKVDGMMLKLAAHDKKNKPLESDDTDTDAEHDHTIAAGGAFHDTLDGIWGRKQPCRGDGKNGGRVQLVYVYTWGNNNYQRYNAGFRAVAHRVNQIFYRSGAESGKAHQVRYVTAKPNNGNCGLIIKREGMSFANARDFSNLVSVLRNRGYKSNDRKYLIWADVHYNNAENCGLGTLYADDKPGQDNASNVHPGYGVIWRGCWNYAEPHELSHNLGAVQNSAPNATGYGHCRDHRDRMCYKDGAGVQMKWQCTRKIDSLLLDCNHNDYYRGHTPSWGYLSKHWNIANSRFLTD